MENIIKMVCEKTGISEAQAKTAIETVVNFIKDKLPGGLGAQVESLVNGGGSGAGEVAGGLQDKLGGMFGK